MAQPPSYMEDNQGSAATVYTLGDALARPLASCVPARTSGAGDCRTAGCSPGAKHETAARGRSRRPADGATRSGRMGAAGWSAAAAVWAMLHTRARGADCPPSPSIRGRRLRRRGRLGARSPVASWLRRTCGAVAPSCSSSCSSLRPSRWSDICISLSRGFRGRVQTHTKSSLTHFRVLLKVSRGGLQFFPRDVISLPPFNISSYHTV